MIVELLKKTPKYESSTKKKEKSDFKQNID
jgi:hypothetical protein